MILIKKNSFEYHLINNNYTLIIKFNFKLMETIVKEYTTYLYDIVKNILIQGTGKHVFN